MHMLLGWQGFCLGVWPASAHTAWGQFQSQIFRTLHAGDIATAINIPSSGSLCNSAVIEPSALVPQLQPSILPRPPPS